MMPFETEAEVDHYLSGDRIECLICGGSFKALVGQHLLGHGVTAAEYKRRFNIPQHRGLTCKESAECYRNNAWCKSEKNLAILQAGQPLATEKRRAIPETSYCKMSEEKVRRNRAKNAQKFGEHQRRRKSVRLMTDALNEFWGAESNARS